MELCVREIRAWMLCDKLKINDDKTDDKTGDRNWRKVHELTVLQLGMLVYPLFAPVKNLGTWITTNLSRRSSHT